MTGQQLKLQGMSRAAAKHVYALERARIVAGQCAIRNQHLTIEEVREAFESYGWKWDLGNAAGAVFDSQRWECVGYTTAKRAEAHGRVIRVWRLK